MKSNIDALDASAAAREGGSLPIPSDAQKSPPGSPADHQEPAHAPRRLRWLFRAAVLLAAGAFAVGYFPRAKERAAVSRVTRELAVLTVAVTTPVPAKMSEPLSFSGEVKPLTEAAIHARASGYVRRWLVDLGARVEPGQLLAELDTPELDRELAQGRAELAQAEAARALAETTARRWNEMLEAKTVSPQETDEKNAELRLKVATVEAARAKVQRLEEMLRFNAITAPFAGTITLRTLDVGQLVNAGAGRELFRIAQSDKLRVFVRVPQNHARAIAVGQTAELSFPELPGRTSEAKVVRTAGTLDAASRTMLVELEVDNAKGALFAGSYVRVRFNEARISAVPTIPANALLFRNEGTMVGVVNADGKVLLRKVVIGRDFGQTVEVIEGLDASTRVIVNPPDSLVEGAVVRVMTP